jgi:hypothetical protein
MAPTGEALEGGIDEDDAASGVGDDDRIVGLFGGAGEQGVGGLRLFALRHVAHVALNDRLAVHQVDVAHELDRDLRALGRLERQIVVADVLVHLELAEVHLRSGDVPEGAELPDLAAQNLGARQTEKLA